MEIFLWGAFFMAIFFITNYSIFLFRLIRLKINSCLKAKAIMRCDVEKITGKKIKRK